MLKKKQRISNDEWIATVKNIKNIVTESEIKKLEKETISQIKSKTKNKKVAYAWSAGKDSIVLGALCEKAGIKDCMLGRCNLEYPAFIDWIEKNKPEKLEIINTGQDMEWLIKHPEMLFPKADKASRWFNIIQHQAQAKYFKNHGLDIILLGRRKADGNYVGKGDSI